MVSLKIAILALAFAISGGSLFSETFRRNRSLVALAILITFLSSYYLFKSIYADLIAEVKEDIVGTQAGISLPTDLAANGDGFSERSETPQSVTANNGGQAERFVPNSMLPDTQFLLIPSCNNGSNWSEVVTRPRETVLEWQWAVKAQFIPYGSNNWTDHAAYSYVDGRQFRFCAESERHANKKMPIYWSK